LHRRSTKRRGWSTANESVGGTRRLFYRPCVRLPDGKLQQLEIGRYPVMGRRAMKRSMRP
jgi:hypothetical protein